jgi:hypothetical protein
MTEQSKKKDEFDIFIARSIYPEAASIFTSRLEPLEKIKDNCCVVLDTNVLLAPYIIGKEDPDKENLLSECGRIYQNLVDQKRIVIPGQVAREFAKNRVQKLVDLYQQLIRKRQQIQQISKGKYPLLYSLSEYQEVQRLESEINNNIRKYQKAIEKVLSTIQGWQLHDPVRELYSKLFTEDTVLEPSFDEKDIVEDLKRRKIHNIPPGYKDSGKDDSGIGDLIIWHTILEIARNRRCNIIFVSNDEKPDWFQKSENTALYVKYELIDEFRRNSEGCSLHIIKFSRFLKLYGAKEETIEEVKKEEIQINEDFNEKKDYADQLIISMLSFINSWKSLPREENGMIAGYDYTDYIKNIAMELIKDLNKLQAICQSKKVLEEETITNIKHVVKDLHLLEAKTFYLDGGKSFREFDNLTGTISTNMEIIIGDIQARLRL